jgi:hypothetical protein
VSSKKQLKVKSNIEIPKAAFTSDEFAELAQRIWVPALADMMLKDVELALKDVNDKGAADARERIYNRLVGKPTETVKQESKQMIQIVIKPAPNVAGEIVDAISVREIPLLGEGDNA